MRKGKGVQSRNTNGKGTMTPCPWRCHGSKSLSALRGPRQILDCREFVCPAGTCSAFGYKSAGTHGTTYVTFGKELIEACHHGVARHRKLGCQPTC